MLDQLADIMTFGTLAPCENCKGGQFVFKTGGYVCQGDLTEWSKCNKIVKEPKRTQFIIPEDLSHYSFLSKYSYVPRVRIIKDVKPKVVDAVKKEDPGEGRY